MSLVLTQPRWGVLAANPWTSRWRHDLVLRPRGRQLTSAPLDVLPATNTTSMSRKKWLDNAELPLQSADTHLRSGATLPLEKHQSDLDRVVAGVL
jgi:hypothetical protein